jgi:hypothetical protein
LEETTDKNGELKVHAFYGDYKITCNGESKTITLSKAQVSGEINF